MDPPLSIPNREVKRTYADGTDRPVGRVGSRRSSDSRAMKIARLSFFVPFGPKNEERRLPLSVTPKPPLRGLSRSKLLQTWVQNRRTAATFLFRGSAPKVPCGSLLPYFALAKYPHRRARWGVPWKGEPVASLRGVNCCYSLRPVEENGQKLYG